MDYGLWVFNWILEKIIDLLGIFVEWARRCLGRAEVEVKERKNVRHFTQDLSELFLDIADSISKSTLFRTIHTFFSFLTWVPSLSLYVGRERECGFRECGVR